MTAPLFDAPAGVLAIPIGIAFGFTLERAGLGSAATIADQLRARDFTVLKVMFSAIVTAMLGVFWANRVGWLDLSRVAIPVTDIVPQLTGAVLFGAGFAIASLCPGTACVSAATGKRDGLVTIGGLFIGTLVVSLFWSQLGRIAERAPSENATLAGDLGVSPGVIVAVITVIALLMITIADRITGQASPGRLKLSPLATVALTLGALAVVGGGNSLPASGGVRAADEVAPIELARWLRDRKPGVRVIDVRDSVAADDYRIPGSELVTRGELSTMLVKDSDVVVLYGDHAADALPARDALRKRGAARVVVLSGGLDGWDAEVMSPRAPDQSDSGAVARFAPVRELSAWFGGKPTNDATPPRIPSGTLRRRRSC